MFTIGPIELTGHVLITFDFVNRYIDTTEFLTFLRRVVFKNVISKVLNSKTTPLVGLLFTRDSNLNTNKY